MLPTTQPIDMLLPALLLLLLLFIYLYSSNGGSCTPSDLEMLWHQGREISHQPRPVLAINNKGFNMKCSFQPFKYMVYIITPQRGEETPVARVKRSFFFYSSSCLFETCTHIQIYRYADIPGYASTFSYPRLPLSLSILLIRSYLQFGEPLFRYC